MDRITKLLQKYISDRIPKTATNIFWQMFNGIEASLTALEYRLDISKRERNVLAAQSKSSLRNLASQNGFEPSLKVPSKGLISVNISTKLFKRVGYPLFIKPYSVFENTENKLKYHYISDKPVKITKSNVIIPVVEGEIKTTQFSTEGNHIERIYLTDDNVAEGSIVLEMNGITYQEVKSFVDNQGVNDDKLFMIKFSSNTQTPIVIYVQNIEKQITQLVNVTYRLTFGELGNLDSQTQFSTEDLIDSLGNQIQPEEEEIDIHNVNGFDFGSNGTDENALRSAIGYNHGIGLLFDTITYTNFLNKYSTILVQKVFSAENQKTIKNLFISKKQTPVDNVLVNQYKSIINNKQYLFAQTEKLNLSKNINEYEFALSSHNIYDSNTCKFAFQITFKTQALVDKYSTDLEKLIYQNFFGFLYKKAHTVNLEILFNDFMVENNVKFSYTIFNELNELDKINTGVYKEADYIITHENYLPIIKGNFKIIDSNDSIFDLFFDVNICAY